MFSRTMLRRPSPLKEIQHTTKQTKHVVDVPNLVELQLDSYRWFLEEGLKELFESFSPISDFTGNHSIELIDARVTN